MRVGGASRWCTDIGGTARRCGGWGNGQNIDMPRSGDAEEGLLAPAQPSERCGPKAKKTSLAVATIVVAAVVFIKFVGDSDNTSAETPQVPDDPDDRKAFRCKLKRTRCTSSPPPCSVDLRHKWWPQGLCSFKQR